MVTPWWVRFDPGRFDRDLWADAMRVGLFALGLGLLWRRRGDVRTWLFPREAGPSHPRSSAWPGLCLLVATLCLLVWYAASSFASWFYARYLSPLLLISTLALARLLLVLAEKRPLAALVLVAVSGWSVPWDALASYRSPIEKGNIMYTNQLPMVEARVPKGECVAALQSGTLGYFRDCVVNLDGKVNPAVLTRRSDIWRYLDERKVRAGSATGRRSSGSTSGAVRTGAAGRQSTGGTSSSSIAGRSLTGLRPTAPDDDGIAVLRRRADDVVTREKRREAGKSEGGQAPTLGPGFDPPVAGPGGVC